VWCVAEPFVIIQIALKLVLIVGFERPCQGIHSVIIKYIHTQHIPSSKTARYAFASPIELISSVGRLLIISRVSLRPASRGTFSRVAWLSIALLEFSYLALTNYTCVQAVRLVEFRISSGIAWTIESSIHCHGSRVCLSMMKTTSSYIGATVSTALS
jgi:hypothetical protein